MNVLALDLTSEFGSLAIHSGGRITAERHLHSREGFAHLVFPAIEQILSDADLKLQSIDCFAAASGPGAFTGVRVGLSAVKGLAEANGKPAVGISNLRALAMSGSGERRAVVLDARRGEVFAAIYANDLEVISPEVVMKLQDWLAAVRALSNLSFIAPISMRDSLPAAARFMAAPQYLAPAIAECAMGDGPQKWCDPALLDANYVRRSDAELFWRE